MAEISGKKRIILLANTAKSHAVQVGCELRSWLIEHAELVADNCQGEPLDLGHLPPLDFMVVLGGDGTILSTARALGERQIPIIGVNMGKLGFLAEFTIEQLKEHFEQVVRDGSLISNRVLLNCRIVGPRRAEYSCTVVNEVAVVAGPPFRMIEVSISVGDEHLAVCDGDGLVIATSTGSTAYNLSAGGPILASNLQAAVITPLAAHSLSFRPIVLGLDKPISLRCRSHHAQNGSVEKDEEFIAVASIDGQENSPFTDQDRIIITRADYCFQLVRNPSQGPWEVLNTKLNWGALPNYEPLYDRRPRPIERNK